MEKCFGETDSTTTAKKSTAGMKMNEVRSKKKKKSKHKLIGHIRKRRRFFNVAVLVMKTDEKYLVHWI